MSLIMVVAMLPVTVISTSAESETVKFATISDVHWYDITDDTVIDDGFTAKTDASTEQVVQAPGLLDSALEAIKNDGVDYLLVSGDLTFNGELSGHKAIAARLEQFEAETGIPVIVTNGNHDLNNDRAMKYYTDEETGENYWDYCDSATTEDWLEIYQNLGYDIAYHKYESEYGWAGNLSYSVNLGDSFRLIVIDAAKYTADNTDSGLNVQETGGNITEDTLEWVLNEIAEAKADGREVIGMTHWNLSPVNYFQGYVMKGFVMDSWEQVAEQLADAGMHFVFTGHSHLNDISSVTSDNGEVLYTIETDSLVCFPNQYRLNTFTNDNGKITADFQVVDADRDMQVVDANGKTYSRPYRVWSYNHMYANGSGTDMALQMIEPTIRNLLSEISQVGLVSYIEGLIGFDLTSYFDELLHGGLVLDNQNIVTAYNVMGVINDIGTQIEMKYIDNPDYTIDILTELIRSLADLQVSTYPCNHWYNTYGLGSNNRPGTLADAVMSAMLYMYQGNEDASNDLFMQDVLERFESGELCRLIVEWVEEYFIKGFLEDELLSSINLNLSSFFIGESAEDLAALLLEIEGKLDGVSLWDQLKATFITVMEKNNHDVSVIPENLQKIVENLDIIMDLLGQEGISSYYYMLVEMLTPEQLNSIFEMLIDATGIEGMVDNLTVDRSILGIANLVLSFGILDWGNSVDEIVDWAIDKYVTDEELEGVGYQVATILGSLINDSDPQFLGDFDVTYVYDGPVEVVPTKEDYRLPSIITTTFGSDASSEYNISWYSKTTLEATDFEIYESSRYETAPIFTGENTLSTSDLTIDKDSQTVTRSFYGVDFGVFGLLAYEFDLQHHTVSLSNLKPNTTYYYRIGNAERNWWSEVGTINTSTTTGTFTFIHVTDSQSQTQAQYDRSYGKVLESAFNLYPETAFILHTGDFVDHGDNVHQWTYCTNASEEYAMQSAIMPASGNHEGYGDYAISDNFNVELADEEYDTYNGVYYSFDYDSAHIAVLNTNDLCQDGTLSIAQYNWLKEDMENSDATWKFVAIHKAVYSNGDHYADDDVCALRDQLSTLMPELDIDMVFQGHDHVYLRTDALNNNQIFSYDKDVIFHDNLTVDAMVNPDGTVYVISGASGVKSYVQNDETVTDEYFPRAVKTSAVDNPIYSAITIDGNNLFFKAYTVDENGNTTEIDSFGIEKMDNMILVGDTNLNGRVTAADAREALRAAAGLERIVDESRCAADVNGDGFVSASDARKILRVSAELEEFPEKYRVYDEEKYAGEYKTPMEVTTTELDLFH